MAIPLVAALGLAGTVGGWLGLGKKKPNTGASQGVQRTPTQQAAHDNAYMRGYLGTTQGRMGAQAQAGGNVGASQGTGAGSSRRANQRGGAQNAMTPDSIRSQNQGAMQGVLSQGLSGQGTDPQAFRIAQQRGANTINLQAEQSRNILGENLARRGLLQSGIMGQGLANVESGRLGALANLSAQTQTAQMADASSSRQWAADVVARLQQGQAQITSSEAQQRRAINASQPSTFDRLAGLAGTYASYRYAPDTPELDYERLLGLNRDTPASTPTQPQFTGGDTTLRLR